MDESHGSTSLDRALLTDLRQLIDFARQRVAVAVNAEDEAVEEAAG